MAWVSRGNHSGDTFLGRVNWVHIERVCALNVRVCRFTMGAQQVHVPKGDPANTGLLSMSREQLVGSTRIWACLS